MRTKKVLTIAFMLVLFGGSGFVFADETSVILRIPFSYVTPLSDSSVDFYDPYAGDIHATVQADPSFGFGLSSEYKFTEKVGLEVGILFSDVDFEVETMGVSVDLGSSLMMPLFLECNYHPLKSEKVDFYFGPLVAYTMWGNLDVGGGSLEMDNDFGFGAAVGVDVPFGSSDWMFTSSMRYISASTGDSSLELKVDPLFVNLGVGYRF